MRIIHCADLHLDSALRTHFDKDHGKKRRAEILNTFEKMVDYAADNGVNAILIAGDMFDTKYITANTRNTVMNKIYTHQSISFFYLAGNHDKNNFLSNLDEIPDNLHLFDQSWTAYKMNDIIIQGIELSPDNSRAAYLSLVLDPKYFNIVMMHGQESEGNKSDNAEVVRLKELRNKSIDYLALGHIHSYKYEHLDARGYYCYPGCLDGRGFDECGEHGFVLLDINEKNKTFTHEFIPFASRNLYSLEVDVSGCMTTAQIIEVINQEIKQYNYSRKSIIRVILTGALDVECEKDITYIESNIGSQYFYLEVVDNTRLRVNLEDYILNETLKGEYVRTVLADDSIPENDKSIIIRYGLQAISGEEVE